MNRALTRFEMAFVLGAAVWLSAARPAQAQTAETILSLGIHEPYGIAVDDNNQYYIADSANNRIARLTPDTLVLTNFAGFPSPDGGAQDGQGSFARFYGPEGLIYAPLRGGFVVADTGNHRIRLVTTEGFVSTLAGSSAGRQDGVGLAAKFNAPTGLASDSAGNVYIADLQNNLIRKLALDNTVTTLAPNSGFLRPSGVAVGENGRIYVADMGNHSIKAIETNGTVTLVAGSGSRLYYGLKDAPVATDGLLDNPNGLLWLGSASGLLVSDSGNHLVRRIFANSSLGTTSIETLAAAVGIGLDNPAGLAADLTGNVLISDPGTDKVIRLHSTQTVQPPVSNPEIGVIFTNSNFSGFCLNVITNQTYNNDVVVAIESEDGTQTFYTLGDSNDPNGIPDPTPRDSVPPEYFGCGSDEPSSLLNPMRPDTTIKAISIQAERRPSKIVTARIRFQVANPNIYGNNPGSFTMDTSTAGAELWYTTDQTDPVINGQTSILYNPGSKLNVLDGTNDVVVKVRGFKNNYSPSSLVQRTFSFTNLLTSSIGFPRNFSGANGSTLVIPMELRLVNNDTLQSLQFRAEVRPNGTAPAIQAPVRLLSLTGNEFVDTTASHGRATATSSYWDGTSAGVAVAYLGSNALDRVIQSGPVALLGVTLPGSAQVGDIYSLVLRNASATEDGLTADLALNPLPNRFLLVTNVGYLVGDSSGAVGYNAGDFGDGALNNNDVNNAFYASLGVRVPFPFTDAFDALDAFPVDTMGAVGGDGQIRFLDWQVILERSLHLRTDNWRRSRAVGGLRTSVPTTLKGFSSAPGSSETSVSGLPTAVWPCDVRIHAGTVGNVSPGQTIRVPISLEIKPGKNLAGLQFWPVISRRADATDSSLPYVFEPNPDLHVAEPSLNSAPGFSTNNIIYVWNNGRLNPPLIGQSLLGWLSFVVPTATTGDTFTIRFANVDGAPAEQTLYSFERVPGTAWVQTAVLRAATQTSDEWKLAYFGSFTAAEAQDGADPDQDGLTNLEEYQRNTNPGKADFLVTVRLVGGQPVVRWYAAAGKSYGVLVSVNLAAGAAGWRPVGSPVQGSGAVSEVTDVNPSVSTRFYRVEQLP